MCDVWLFVIVFVVKATSWMLWLMHVCGPYLAFAMRRPGSSTPLSGGPDEDRSVLVILKTQRSIPAYFNQGNCPARRTSSPAGGKVPLDSKGGRVAGVGDGRGTSLAAGEAPLT